MKFSNFPKRIWSIAFLSIAFFFVFHALAVEPEEEWNSTFGGQYGDGAWCLQETEDGGNILVGNSASRGEGSDLFLIRTDGMGNCIWSKILGGSGEDVGYFVQRPWTADLLSREAQNPSPLERSFYGLSRRTAMGASIGIKPLVDLYPLPEMEGGQWMRPMTEASSQPDTPNQWEMAERISG